MATARRTRMEALLESAEDLAQLGSWEHDLRTGQTMYSKGLFRILGQEPDTRSRTQDEIVGGAIHPDDRERVDAMLTLVATRPEDVPPEGVHFELRLVRPDGTTRQVVGHGRVERDEDGVPERWVGTMQDVTEQRLTERELQAHYAVSQALRDWESFEEGVVGLLRRLGTALELPLGCLWVWDNARGRIVCRALWSAPDIDAASIEEATFGTSVAPGERAIGQAWERQEPVVIPDVVSEPGFHDPLRAVELGVRSGVVVPAVGPKGTVAVLSFYGFERREPSARLLRTLTGIGRDLGRFLARRRGQLEPRRLSARELEVLRLAAAGQSGPQIAEQLVVSPSTVKTHFENIYEKLGVGDRAGAVAHALRLGLIE